MSHPIDFDGINAVALRSARQLLQELFPTPIKMRCCSTPPGL